MKMNSLITTSFLAIALCVGLYADYDPNSTSCIIDGEFINTEHAGAPLNVWASAGSHAEIDSVFTVDVTAIPDSITYVSEEGVDVPIPEAQSGLNFDNSDIFNNIISWVNENIDSVYVHTQIYIPEGVYIFNSQIVMKSNISLKGAGSDLTELRLLIRAFPTDPADSIMTHLHCKKDAIRINGSGNQPNQLITNVGIEDIKIVTRSAHNSSRPFSLGSFQ